jgi:hypothetical protein
MPRYEYPEYLKLSDGDAVGHLHPQLAIVNVPS